MTMPRRSYTRREREAAVDLARMIGPRAAGVRLDIPWRTVQVWVHRETPRFGAPYAPEAPTDVDELARFLRYSKKVLAEMEETHGKGLLRVLQAEWRDLQEKGRFLDRNPARPLTSDPSRAVDDEAISEAAENAYAQRNREKDEIRELVLHPERVIERDLLKKQNKLRKLQAEARRNGVDISPELNQAIAAVQAKITSRRAA